MDFLYIKKMLSKIEKVRPKILVFGDIMLDEYIHGYVNRISPEAPVPILNFKKKHEVLGGAGNVAHNLTNLGAEVEIATIIGDDRDGLMILKLLKSLRLSSKRIIKSKNIKTTKKTRFLSNGTQLLRLDNDSDGSLIENLNSFKSKITKNFNNFNCVIISDYNKGFCSEKKTQLIINLAIKSKIPVYIDPKGLNWNKYKGATCITPNTKEIQDKLSSVLTKNADFKEGARHIMKKFKLKSCLITLGNKGMIYCDKNQIIHQNANKKEVFDVSGAGDTAISCFVVSLASGLSLEDSLKLSCIVSSEVVTHIGTTPFNKSFLN